MRKLKNLVTIFAIAMGCFCISKTGVLAKTKTVGVNPLKKDKVYEYNLDQKGAKEKVKVTKDSKGGVLLSINNKIVLSDLGKRGAVFIVDTNRSDKQMEILITDNYWENTQEDLALKYYRYSEGELKKIQDLENVAKAKYKKIEATHGASSKRVLTTDQKGNLTLGICLRVENHVNYDYLHFNDNFILKNGKFVISKIKTFKIKNRDVSSSKGSNKVYKKPGNKKVLFQLKDKEEFYCEEVYIQSNSVYYIKIKTKKGKIGYIKNGQFKAYNLGTDHV